MTYDNWKTTNPDDALLGSAPRPSVSADEIIAFVRDAGETTAAQTADHFGISNALASGFSSRMSKLAAYGLLRSRYVPKQRCGKISIYSMPGGDK